MSKKPEGQKGKPRGDPSQLKPGLKERATTKEMREVKRERFCYAYLTKGSSMEAARYAGVAESRSGASHYLLNPKTQEMIKKLLAEAQAGRQERIADIGEVMEYLTKVMRGEIAATNDSVVAAMALGRRLGVRELPMIARIWTWRTREVSLDVRSLFTRKRAKLKDDFDAEEKWGAEDWDDWWASL